MPDIDMEELIKQATDAALRKAIVSLFPDGKDQDSMRKLLSVFDKYGVPSFIAVQIMAEISEVFTPSNDKETQKYVCKHCGKSFDKAFSGDISVSLWVHLNSEHKDISEQYYGKTTDEMVANNFMEE